MEPKWREAWALRCRGQTFSEIAGALEISVGHAQSWCARYAELERGRRSDFEAERDVLVQRFEAAAADSWEVFGRLPDASRSKAEHMGNVLRALQMAARLRGMEIRAQAPAVQIRESESEVVIRVGGEEMVRRRFRRDPGVLNGNAVEVASREMAALGGAGGSSGVASEGSGAGGD